MAFSPVNGQNRNADTANSSHADTLALRYLWGKPATETNIKVTSLLSGLATGTLTALFMPSGEGLLQIEGFLVGSSVGYLLTKKILKHYYPSDIKREIKTIYTLEDKTIIARRDSSETIYGVRSREVLQTESAILDTAKETASDTISVIRIPAKRLSIHTDTIYTSTKGDIKKNKDPMAAFFWALFPGAIVHGLGHHYAGHTNAFVGLLCLEGLAIVGIAASDVDFFAIDGPSISDEQAFIGGVGFIVLFGTWIYDIIAAPVLCMRDNQKRNRAISLKPYSRRDGDSRHVGIRLQCRF